jgi:GTP pyrophosphokinase
MDTNPHHDPAKWRHLAEAANFALTIHARQIRKGSGIPYIAHLFGVASLVLEHGDDEEQAIAGLPHDAIEDAGASQEAVIAEQFGQRVAPIVRACTDTDIVPKPPWRARKEAYVAHLATVDRDALLVSASDKLHNARAICTDLRTHGVAVYDRFTGGEEGTLWYYRSLADAFTRLLPGALATELAGAVDDMERLSRDDVQVATG